MKELILVKIIRRLIEQGSIHKDLDIQGEKDLGFKLYLVSKLLNEVRENFEDLRTGDFEKGIVTETIKSILSCERLEDTRIENSSWKENGVINFLKLKVLQKEQVIDELLYFCKEIINGQ